MMLIFQLKDNCFTEFYLFSVKHPQESAIGTPMSPPSQTSFPSLSPSYPSDLSQSTCLSSLSGTARPIGYLFYIWYCKSPRYSPYISPPHSPPPVSVSPSFMSVSPFSHSVVSDFLQPHDCSTPGFPVHPQLLELAQAHVHRVSDAIQPSHPLSSPSPPAFSLSQHQCLFQ